MGEQRTGARRPPARARSRSRAAGEQSVPAPTPPGSAVPEVAAPRRRPRLTGRTAVLVLVLAVLTVSYASSMRAYLQQRAYIGDLKAEISEREQSIDELNRERERWDDPAFVAQQARERFGYVMPGDTSYVVLDEDGSPLKPEASLSEREPVDPATKQAWWDRGWASVQLAGNPPDAEEPPLTRIDGPDQ